MGEWASGRVGEWASGRLGEWASGRVLRVGGRSTREGIDRPAWGRGVGTGAAARARPAGKWSADRWEHGGCGRPTTSGPGDDPRRRAGGRPVAIGGASADRGSAARWTADASSRSTDRRRQRASGQRTAS
ncbi:conserved hypothetical protein [Frankia sp. AiPs1]